MCLQMFITCDTLLKTFEYDHRFIQLYFGRRRLPTWSSKTQTRRSTTQNQMRCKKRRLNQPNWGYLSDLKARSVYGEKPKKTSVNSAIYSVKTLEQILNRKEDHRMTNLVTSSSQLKNVMLKTMMEMRVNNSEKSGIPWLCIWATFGVIGSGGPTLIYSWMWIIKLRRN